ncbi:MAG: PAS domain-containing protein [Alphaproteobacteria bacterium]|nr:PAS domain-containing protein [Alphaproteobacteria bacterium]
MEITTDVLVQSIETSNLAHTISLIRDDLPLVYVNQAFLDTTGYTRDEVLGRNCRFLQGSGTNPETVRALKQSVVAFEAIEVEILNYKKDGSAFWNQLRIAPVLDAGGDAVAFVGIQSDVTRIKEQSRHEQEWQKLEALGRLSANVSHEITNAVQPIKLMSETLRDWQDLTKKQTAQCVEIIYQNVNIVDTIIQDVLRLSKTTSEDADVISARDLAADVVRFTQNMMHSRIKYSTLVWSDTADAHVRVRQSHLYQVILNIVNNALYAMDNAGELRVACTILPLGAKEATRHFVEPGAYFSMSFRDTGSGMDGKTERSVFDPFFTTKPAGEGTGLGLSVSYQLIKEQGGTITVQSKKGKGSTFSILLPVVNGSS